MREIPNSALKLKDIPKKFNNDWEEFALSFNGYKYGDDVCLTFPITVEEYYTKHGKLLTHLTLSELRMCLFFVQRRFRHNGFLPPTDYLESLYDAIRLKVKSYPTSRPKEQKTSFGLYNKRSTFFDLIDGELETKQTKGLAYVFHACPDFLAMFLEKFLARHGVSSLDFDFIAVDAEMLSEDTPPIRRDITISCYVQNIKKCVVVIEGKSIKGTKHNNVTTQLQRYMRSEHFPEDTGIPIIGVSLTKYRHAFEPWSSLVSVTWIEVIQLLWDYVSDHSSSIAKEYLDFLIKVDHGMHFYETEVLSLAAKKTEAELKKHHMYACANHKNHPTALYMAFRSQGGIMDTLYKVDRVFVGDPKHESFEQQASFLPESEKSRVLAFVEERKEGYGFKYDEDYRFYILSETEKITLPHNPRPEVPNQSPKRYSLSILLSGQEIV